MQIQSLAATSALLFATIQLHAQLPFEQRGRLLTAEQIVAVVGSDKEAAAIAVSAIQHDALRRFRDPSSGDSVVALLDSQWREQWLPKESIVNAKDGRRVTFARLSTADAAARYEQCGRLLLLRGFAVVDDTLKVQVVEEGPCSSSGLALMFRNVQGRWHPDGEPTHIGDVRASCRCP